MLAQCHLVAHAILRTRTHTFTRLSRAPRSNARMVGDDNECRQARRQAEEGAG
jgi:hypothetical protein